MIQLSRICKYVIQNGQKMPILQGIDLHISTSEFVSIMGPSGSGKSTLLNIIGLLDAPSSGDYRFRSINVGKLRGNGLADFRNKYIGFAFQSFMLIPRLTVKENVEMPLIYSKMGRKEIHLRVSNALEQVDWISRLLVSWKKNN